MAENIHDKFFKENFSRQDIAADFIREIFPNKLVDKLNFDAFTLTNNSYVDPTLEEYFADIIYSCQYKTVVSIRETSPLRLPSYLNTKAIKRNTHTFNCYVTCLTGGKKPASRISGQQY